MARVHKKKTDFTHIEAFTNDVPFIVETQSVISKSKERYVGRAHAIKAIVQYADTNREDFFRTL